MTRVEGAWLADPAAQRLLRALGEAGRPAYFVGGCVRDALLGLPVADLDVATAARPDEVAEIAGAAGFSVHPTGAEFGTVTVVRRGASLEVTTFRRDVSTDGRRAVVAFSDSVREDAGRRDFTINALYADAEGAVTDPLGALPDLSERRIRFIGDADRRIREDYLRILRFFRFLAVFGRPGQAPDPDGLAACARNADGLARLSRERVGAETLKLLGAPDPAPALAAMEGAGVLAAVLPGAAAAPLARLAPLERGAGAAPDPIRRLAALGGGDPRGRLRLSNRQARSLAAILDGARGGAGAAELAYRAGIGPGLDALLVRCALDGGALPDGFEADLRAGAGAAFPVAAADLPCLRGPALGAKLEELERAWIASGFALAREDLLGRAGFEA